MPGATYPEFVPRFPWRGPDLQTLRNVLRGPALPAAPIEGRKELLFPMRDGSNDRLAGLHFTAEAAPGSPGDRPLVVVVHGLGGSSDSAYIQVTTAHLLGLGYAVLQLNLRGAGASRPHCENQYHAGRSRDLHDVLSALPSDLVPNGVVVVGYSLGGNMVLKYTAEFGEVRGAASISAPIDLEAASYRFLDTRNRVYHAHLIGGMKQEMRSTPGGLTEDEQNRLEAARTILDFDEHIVAPRNGFTGAKDYYDQNHARQFLGDIQVPALLMHALDDPWIPASMYTDYAWSRNPRLEALLPPGGGHVGFHGRGDRVPWHDRCLEVFLARL